MKIFNISVYIFIVLSLSYVLFTTLNKKEIELNKTEFIKAKFISIYENTSAKRSSISYNLEIENNSNILKIIPEYYNCFDYQNFKNEVKPNQMIELRIDKDENFIFKNIKSIISLKVNSKEYIKQNCVNYSIQKSKIRIPLILLGGLILILIIKFAEKKFIKKY